METPLLKVQSYTPKEADIVSRGLAIPLKEESDQLFEFFEELKSNHIVEAGLKTKANYLYKDEALAITTDKMQE